MPGGEVSREPASRWVSLEALGERQCFARNVRQQLLDAASIEGSLILLPISVQRQNLAFYNLRALAGLDVSLPETPSEPAEFGAALQGAGFAHPFCVGNKWAWTMDFFAFEALLPALTGAEFHEQFWRGQASVDDPRVRQSLELLLELWPLFNADANELTWAEGVDKFFVQGPDACVMTVMGSWAGSYFDERGWELDRDFIMRAFPGSDELFVFSGDGIALAQHESERDQYLALLATSASPEGQSAYAAAATSSDAADAGPTGVPARLDADVSSLSATQRSVHAALVMTPTLTGSFRLLSPSGSFPELGQRVRQMLEDGNVDAVLDYLRDEIESLSEPAAE
jgi:glucose/mannose transport system substrate-binding protein